jgi:hypothetical protein
MAEEEEEEEHDRDKGCSYDTRAPRARIGVFGTC